MRDLSELEYHGTSEKLVKVLCDETQNSNPNFFRILVAYYFAKVASMMRVTVKAPGGAQIPVNIYAINLATSGFGKGHSTRIIEDSVIDQFQQCFLEETFPLIAEQELPKIAHRRAMRKSTDPDEELERVEREFEATGPLLFSFSEGTGPAVKQLRHKLLMTRAGSLNFEIDEIGSNLLGNMELFTTYLELYDMGKIKQKLVKNTSDNQRTEEIMGQTPANLMAFGTPTKLLNGGKTEDEFYSLLDTGYARRCLFGFARKASKNKRSPGEIYDLMTSTVNSSFMDHLSDDLGALADIINFNKELQLSKDVAIDWIEYQLYCNTEADKLGEHDEIRKAEISHRYFKALKLAGTYAFIDGSHEITLDHLYNAICMVEESGRAFDQLLARDRAYVKLAKYLADVNREVTHVDLVEDLPFYKGSNQAKTEILNLATAWGYKNNVIIKKSFMDGIEFLRGESLQETDLNEVTISYGQDLAHGYMNEKVPFDQLHKLTQAPGFHWVAHHLIDGHRQEENAIPGFNLVVIDVDGGTPLSTAQLLLKDYKCMFYTTKRHSNQDNRYRVVLPVSYTLKLDAKDYKEFMANIYEWLPFPVDDQTGQRARKWLSHNGQYHYNDGEVLDPLQFIPKTSKNEERKQRMLDQQSLSNLERWFLNNTGAGNRSNQLIKYALLLVDSGKDIDQVREGVMALNNKLPDNLSEAEIMSTILKSATQALIKRDAQAA